MPYPESVIGVATSRRPAYHGEVAVPKLIPSYTVEDYSRWQGDWELWEGIPVAMSPSPSREHQRAAFQVAYILRQAIERAKCQSCEVLYEIDWIVSAQTVVRPDVLVTCDSGESLHIEHPPQFIAEVLSESNVDHDLVHKKRLYEEQGVRYYLVVDTREKSWTLFLNEDGFQEKTWPDPLTLELGECQVEISWASLFES